MRPLLILTLLVAPMLASAQTNRPGHSLPPSDEHAAHSVIVLHDDGSEWGLEDDVDVRAGLIIGASVFALVYGLATLEGTPQTQALLLAGVCGISAGLGGCAALEDEAPPGLREEDRQRAATAARDAGADHAVLRRLVQAPVGVGQTPGEVRLEAVVVDASTGRLVRLGDDPLGVEAVLSAPVGDDLDAATTALLRRVSERLSGQTQAER
ncbi:MAG: hypothetical protein AAF791_13555 [Bacteroidota bacterium]